MPEDNINQTNQTEEDKKYSRADMEQTIRERLKQANEAHERKMAETRAELEELRKTNQNAMGGAAAAPMPPQGGMPQANPMQGGQALPPAQGGGQPTLTADEWYSLQQDLEKERKVKNSIDEARQKDKEFDALCNDGKGNMVPGELSAEMAHLPNPAAVVKQLLKDGKSNAEMWALLKDPTTRRVDVVRFLNQLSDKIESSVTRPHPPNYTAPVDTSDIGDTGQEYDISDLVAEHR